jgi:hypothetical protein
VTIAKQRGRGTTGSRHGSPGFAVLTLEFHKEGRLWVGECRELGTATDGRSLDGVEQELVRLVMLHVDGLEELGERERVFKERGIRVYSDHPTEVERKVSVSNGGRGTFVQFKTVPMPPPAAAESMAI